MAGYHRLISSIKRKPFFCLVHHFLYRNVLKEGISSHVYIKEKIILSLTLLCLLGSYVSFLLLYKYKSLSEVDDVWVEKFFYITFFMIVMGFLSVIEWGDLFLEKKDYLNLIHLPIKFETIFLSKIVSVLIFISVVFISTNILSSFIFAFYLARLKSNFVLYFIYFFIVHLVVCYFAYFFIFLFSKLLLSFFVFFKRIEGNRKIVVYIQIFFFIILILLIISFNTFFRIYPGLFSSIAVLKENNSNSFYYLPPMWFVGIYEVLIGNKDPIYFKLAPISIIAIIILVIGNLSIIFFMNKKFMKYAFGSLIRQKCSEKRKNLLVDYFHYVFLKNPIQRAIYDFFKNTLNRSYYHKLNFGGYLSIPIALFISIFFIYEFQNKYGLGFLVDKLLIIFPHILITFIMLGIMITANLPKDFGANWIFRLTETDKKNHYFIGFKKAVFFTFIFPVLILLFILYYFFWGWQNSFIYSQYCFMVSILTLEIFFLNYNKIPFTFSFKSEKRHFIFNWLCLTVLVVSYISVVSYFGFKLLLDPPSFMKFYIIFFIIFLSLYGIKKVIFNRKREIIYEENPDFMKLNLD